MLNEKAIKYIQVNRDATAVNRGFYYQYLHVLQKWVKHYIDGKDVQVFTEVGDDIKEVGGKLVFTQVKSYSESFSFRSKAIQTSLFNFFTLYLEAKLEGNEELTFCFQTNTAVSAKEALLKAWTEEQHDLNGQLLSECSSRVKEMLKGALKKKRDSILAGPEMDSHQREQVKAAFTELTAQLTEPGFERFIQNIRWQFLGAPPELAVEELYQEILTLLQDSCFQQKPIHTLMEVFLSEIYRCSQLSDPKKRMVDRGIMAAILERKTAELSAYYNRQFLDLLDLRFSFVYQSLQALQTEVKGMQGQLAAIHSRAPKALPKRLTLIPYVNHAFTVERNNELESISQMLHRSRHVCITSVGGMGKTVLGKLFIEHFQDQYDHLIWLDCNDGLGKSILFNEGLLRNLGLSLAKEPNEKLISEALNHLNSLPGNNLFVLDEFYEEHLLPELKSLHGWKLLFTSRIRLAETATYEIGKWPTDQAKKIYRFHEAKESVTKEVFEAFFKLVDYNPLVIVLTAKTIHNSHDLDLAKFNEMFSNQTLDDDELKINIKVDGDSNTHLLHVLQKTFDVSKLNPNESFFLKFLSVLPKDIKITDLITWYGKKDAKTNKRDFNNLFNGLHDSGWLVRDGDHIHIHAMVQEALLYKIRAEGNFIQFMFQINWLAHRLREGIVGDFGQALQFLRYGESFLKKIRENDRTSIYQPLLVLENEVLNVYTWISGETKLLERTKDLLERASAYLGGSSGLVGVMHNNLGMAYIEKGLFREAEPDLLESAKILQKIPKDYQSQYLYTTCNLALLYVHFGDLTKFKEWFERGMDYRKSHKLFDDPTFPFQCGMLGFAQQGFGNHEEAIRLLKIAIRAHHELPAEQKNDLSLILYLNNLAFSYIVTGREDKAKELLNEAVERLGKIAIRHNNKLIHILSQTVTGIIQRGADRSELESLLEKLEKMKTDGVDGLD